MLTACRKFGVFIGATPPSQAKKPKKCRLFLVHAGFGQIDHAPNENRLRFG
jgi:hypothetical protein